MMKLLSSILLFTQLFAISAGAQTKADDWGRVESLEPDTFIIVESKDGRSVLGEFQRLTEASVELSRGGKPVSIKKIDVANVYLARKNRSTGQRALIGTLIGAGIGFGVGYATQRPYFEAGFAIIGATAGALFGAATSMKTRKGELLYFAR